jgi:uncharacterized membrane protein YqhA
VDFIPNLGLVVVLVIILVKFSQILIAFIPASLSMNFEDIAMAVLNLLDLSLFR